MHHNVNGCYGFVTVVHGPEGPLPYLQRADKRGLAARANLLDSTPAARNFVLHMQARNSSFYGIGHSLGANLLARVTQSPWAVGGALLGGLDRDHTIIFAAPNVLQPDFVAWLDQPEAPCITQPNSPRLPRRRRPEARDGPGATCLAVDMSRRWLPRRRRPEARDGPGATCLAVDMSRRWLPRRRRPEARDGPGATCLAVDMSRRWLPRRRRPEARDGPGATCLAVDMSRRWLPRRRRPEARDGPGATCLAVDMSRRWLPRRRRPEARDGPGATCLAVDMSRRWSAEPGSFAILRPPMPRQAPLLCRANGRGAI
ncbi:g7355 [Coccomyxa viridis]|uniref:G7355 protein n=1 Tax=Coccomyxa viridis TaxID=1274662 RepID=A0ABP1G479_9CHLO